MHNYYSHPTIINSIISGNKGADGGGIFNLFSNPVIINSTISDNFGDSASSHTNHAAACMRNLVSSPLIYNSIISGSVDNDLSYRPTYYKCMVYGTGGGSSWNPAMGINGGGNIAPPAYFVSSNKQNYRLEHCSPALNKGNIAHLPKDKYDIDKDGDTQEPIPLDVYGNPRLQGNQIDMGAAEGYGEPDTTQLALCSGDSLQINGATYYQQGVYTLNIPRGGKCDFLLIFQIHNAVDIRVALDMNGQSLHVADSSARYQWYDCTADSVLINDTNQRFTPSQIGTYAAIITKDGCTDTSACFTISQVSVKEYQQDLLSYVYPNPSRAVFEVKLNQEVKTYQWRVYDLSGRVIQQGNGKREAENLKLDLSLQKPGVYILQLATNQGVVRVKLLKE